MSQSSFDGTSRTARTIIYRQPIDLKDSRITCILSVAQTVRSMKLQIATAYDGLKKAVLKRYAENDSEKQM
jgi:hypothetical protein